MQILSPIFFNKHYKKIALLSCLLFFIFLPIAFYQAIYNSPQDYQQGDLVRIMYIHVPLAWLSLGLYFMIGIFSFINLVWRVPLCYILAISCIYVGTIFSFLTIITGAIWGKPIWGTYWVWDARLTSMLILFILYLSQFVMITSGENIHKIQKPLCILSIIGVINVPIIKFSVNIWTSLHQPASILRKGGIAIHPEIMTPLLLMFIAFFFYTIFIITLRVSITIAKYKSLTKQNSNLNI